MELSSLWVVHLPKTPAQTGGSDFTSRLGARDLASWLGDCFFLDSCQRQLWVLSEAEFLNRARLDTSLEHSLLDPIRYYSEKWKKSGVELLKGEQAYAFLLKVACGLESQVVGETDIFGQLKQAWKTTAGQSDVKLLLEKVFEDTKEVRSRHLQNLGGASYGSLVRKVLDAGSGPVLLLGAGQIAQAIAPYLLPEFHVEANLTPLPSVSDRPLWVWNRSEENLKKIEFDLIQRGRKKWGDAALTGSNGSVLRILRTDERLDALQTASQILFCVPFEKQFDDEAISILKKRWTQPHRGHLRKIIHLAGDFSESTEWSEWIGNLEKSESWLSSDSRNNSTPLREQHAQASVFVSLQDLFKIQKDLGTSRNLQVQAALRACEERAKHRALGGALSIPHGWEDLATFAHSGV